MSHFCNLFFSSGIICASRCVRWLLVAAVPRVPFSVLQQCESVRVSVYVRLAVSVFVCVSNVSSQPAKKQQQHHHHHHPLLDLPKGERENK